MNHFFKEKVGRSTFLIKNKNSENIKVLKYSSPSKSIHKTIYRIFLGGSLPFQNEIRVLQKIMTTKDLEFKIPELIAFNQKKFIESEYIPKKLISNKEKFKDLLVRSLSSIKNIERPVKWFFVKEYIFNILESPMRKTIWLCFRLKKKYNVKIFKIIYAILKLDYLRSRNQEKISPSVVHNDLGYNNIIYGKDSIIYLIDWEDAIYEHRWPLIDLTDMSLNYNNGQLDNNFLNKYFSFNKLANDNNKDLIGYHVMFGHIRVLLLAINAETLNSDITETLIQSLNNVVEKVLKNKFFKNL